MHSPLAQAASIRADWCRGRKPIAGILAAFGFSGVAHEYLFLRVTSELVGRQFTFFILHGLGAIGGAWLGRRYRALAGRRVPRGVAVAATLGFVLATTPLFTRCFDRIFDLHRDLGRWVLKGIEDLAEEMKPQDIAETIGYRSIDRKRPNSTAKALLTWETSPYAITVLRAMSFSSQGRNAPLA